MLFFPRFLTFAMKSLSLFLLVSCFTFLLHAQHDAQRNAVIALAKGDEAKFSQEFLNPRVDAGMNETRMVHLLRLLREDQVDEALACADHHTIAKHATKEISWQQGHAVTFLPKWSHEKVGSSSHVHQSLWKDGKPAFFDPDRPLGKSELMDHYTAGLIKYAADYTYFMAPYVSSYKRFAKGSFAPTQIVWSVDNRTAAYRLCGAQSKAIRIECRIPGSDMNPYLAQAAMLAAGIRGIEEKLELPEAFRGDAYDDDAQQHIPRNLRDARTALTGSKMLRAAFGGAVIDHYSRAAEWEIEEFERVVTDWEIARGFERA